MEEIENLSELFVLSIKEIMQDLILNPIDVLRTIISFLWGVFKETISEEQLINIFTPKKDEKKIPILYS